MAVRIFLGLSALIWLPYGIYCFLQPASLAEAAGVVFTSPTGATELRAMYGGLQALIGAVALAGLLRPARAPFALLFLLLLTAGLASGRMLGVLLDGARTTYTVFALGVELGTVSVASVRARRQPATA
jgi:hypothetical protein